MEKKMRSAIFTGFNQEEGNANIEIKEFDVPVCDDDKLLIKIQASGLCTFEQRVFTGVHQVGYPFVGGHEVAGRIAAIGKNVRGHYWQIDDPVVVGVTLPCRNCDLCKMGKENICVDFTADQLLPGQPCKGSGGLSEYMMQTPDCVFKYYNVTPEQACFCEPLSCCIHSVETVNPQFGETAVIIGAGIMGLLHLQLCLKKGLHTVILDFNDERLALAEQFGAHLTINPKKQDAEKVIAEATHGYKADCVFDTTPIAEVAEDAVNYLGRGGKLMIYSGIYPDKEIKVDPHWIHKASTQIMGSANSNDLDFMKASRMISNHIIDVDPFISGVYPVEEIKTALKNAPGKFRNIILFQ